MATSTTTLSPTASASITAVGSEDPSDVMMNHLQEVLLLNSDPVSLLNSFEGDDFLEQLAPVVEDALNSQAVDLLVERLATITAQKETEVQELCNSNQQEYTRAVQQLARVKQNSEQMRSSVLGINQSIQQSGRALNKMLKDSQGARSNIDDATAALRQCLKVLHMTNQVYEMIEQKKYFQALKSLDDLQKNHLQEVAQFEFAQRIRHSVPVMKDTIKEDVHTDLSVWLQSVQEVVPQIGMIAFSATEVRRRKWKAKVDKDPQLRFYKLNSAVELAMEQDDDDEHFDPLDNAHIKVDLTPFYDCVLIYTALGSLDEFREQYAYGRVQDKDQLLPKSIAFTDDDISPLENLLHSACGFAIVERATVRMAYKVRTAESVDALWELMCQRIADLIDPVLPTLQNPETLLRVRTLLGLFIQTMESFEFSVVRLHSFMLSLFGKYSDFLKERFAQEFSQSVMEDDYMPMVINQRELWEQVVNISWYQADVDPDKVTFPCVLPFSQVYPLSCAELRNFVNQHYNFADEFTEQNPGQIESRLRTSVDELLVDVVCAILIKRLKSSNREEIVQIFINLEYFEIAASAIEHTLNETATVHLAEPIKLRAVTEFAQARKNAEQRIFELINSKIDDFLEIAEYDWETTVENSAPSSYLVDMVRFLETLVNQTLVHLPKSITSFLYFDAFDHLATSMLDLILHAGRRISKPALHNFNRDVHYVESFVYELGQPKSKPSSSAALTTVTASLGNRLTSRSRNPSVTSNASSNPPEDPVLVRHRSGDDTDDNSLLTTFTELRQTIDLLMSPNIEEYNNTEVRMRKYGRVNPQNAIALVEKLHAAPIAPPSRSRMLYRGRNNN
ncbi:exocyst complex subunit Sec15-like-domain-containing protein [Myxozyma melibiosi]|uniref:Exocyst complex component SEC15 n=1 Tax=Myxozyma melibiosi TaxID=54550 RepID=A0ABR1F7Z5_9ASCO